MNKKTNILFIVGAFVGVSVTFLLLVAVELFSSVVHPVPSDFGNTTEEICEHVARYPQWVLAVVIPAWGTITALSMGTSKRVGGHWAALLVGFLLVAAALLNVSMLPYPAWFKVASVAVIGSIVAYGAATVGRTTTTADLAIKADVPIS